MIEYWLRGTIPTLSNYSDGPSDDGTTSTSTPQPVDDDYYGGGGKNLLFGGETVLVKPAPATFDCCEGTACQPDSRNNFSPRCIPVDASLTNPRANAAGSGSGGCVSVANMSGNRTIKCVVSKITSAGGTVCFKSSRVLTEC